MKRSQERNEPVTGEGFNGTKTLWIRRGEVMEQLVASGSIDNISRGPQVGDLVEVATRFTGSWSRGFVVVDVDHHAYRLRRLSDGHVLPIAFAAHELRADRRRADAPSAGAA